MKRWILYSLLVASTFFAPVRRVDVGTLQPVEIICISKEEEIITIRTDTGDFGQGETIGQAVKDLQDTAMGIVYFDTAEFLLLDRGVQTEVAQLLEQLHASVRVCLVQGEPDLTSVKKYLRAHGYIPQIKQWMQGERLPVLLCENS